MLDSCFDENSECRARKSQDVYFNFLTLIHERSPSSEEIKIYYDNLDAAKEGVFTCLIHDIS